MKAKGWWGRPITILLIALGFFLFTPSVIGYLYLESTASRAMANNERTAATFADRLKRSWKAELPHVGDVKSSVGEVSIYSSTRSERRLSLEVLVVTSKENLFGTTDFARCYSLEFEELRLGLFQHTAEWIPDCPYNKG